MADTWQSVEGVAKDDQGNFKALVGGKWVDATNGAKNAKGEYMAILPSASKSEWDDTSKQIVPLKQMIERGGKQYEEEKTGMAGVGQAALTRAKQLIPETGAAFQKFGLGPIGYLASKYGANPLQMAVGNRLEKASAKYEEELQQIPQPERIIGSLATDIAAPELAGAGVRGVRTLKDLAQTAAKDIGLETSMAVPKAEQRAAKIAQESFGKDLPEVKKVLAETVDKDITASQALSALDKKTGKPALTVPTAQALLQRAELRDPEFFGKLFGKQESDRIQQLTKIAGGADQTAARQARDELRKFTNEKLIPTLNTELSSANIAGSMKPKLEKEAARMAAAAEMKVQDVRDFTAAKDRAVNLSRQMMIDKGLPVGAAKYTYVGELANKAEDVAKQSADASLKFGEASRFADAASQSLEAHGLKPLESKSIVSSIKSKLNDPSIAGNKDLETVLNRVGKDIQKWTDNNGVIDAFALNSIRQNSINSVAKQLFKGDPAAEKKFAGEALNAVKPVIIDAIENAGGTGYRKYLEDYSKASQEIAQTKAGAEALRMYQSSPQEFVRFVEGNKPEDVEKIFGSGKYDLAKEMSQSAKEGLDRVASEVKSQEAAKEQAKSGTVRLEEILKKNASKFRLPNFLSKKSTMANATLDVLESRLNKKTMEALTESAKSAKNFEDLLNGVPMKQRKEIESVINDPETSKIIAKTLSTGYVSHDLFDAIKDYKDATQKR